MSNSIAVHNPITALTGIPAAIGLLQGKSVTDVAKGFGSDLTFGVLNKPDTPQLGQAPSVGNIAAAQQNARMAASNPQGQSATLFGGASNQPTQGVSRTLLGI